MCDRDAVECNSTDSSGEAERRREMIRKWNIGTAGALVAMLLCGSGVARAQYGGAKPAQTPAPSQTGTTTPAPKPLTLDNAAPAPVNAEEDAAFKEYQDSPQARVKNKMELMKDFVL